jgi:hypothetical protein
MDRNDVLALIGATCFIAGSTMQWGSMSLVVIGGLLLVAAIVADVRD